MSDPVFTFHLKVYHFEYFAKKKGFLSQVGFEMEQIFHFQLSVIISQFVLRNSLKILSKKS